LILVLLRFYRRQTQKQDLKIDAPQIRSQFNTPVSTSSESLIVDLAWQGFKEFIVQRREFENDNHSICSFYLEPTDRKLLPKFKPGQFLTFRLQIEDPATHEIKSVVRCYSLSDQPQTDCYRVTIKRVLAPVGQSHLPSGISSGFFHDQVYQGSKLLLKAPSGHFHLMDDEALPIVLIAGGIGVTPMLSILNTLLEAGSQRPLWFFYGVRNGAEQIMKKHLESLVSSYTNFHLQLCYSKPRDFEVQGVDYHHKSRIDIPLLRGTLKKVRYQFYVCGPKPMMESLVPGLQRWGVDSNDIYYESFGPATLVKHKKADTATKQAITVTFSQSGKSISWDPAADSLLEFAEANGIDVASGCRAGSCGTCQTVLEKGEVEYNQQPDADIELKHCLLCIATPKGDITLAA